MHFKISRIQCANLSIISLVQAGSISYRIWLKLFFFTYFWLPWEASGPDDDSASLLFSTIVTFFYI